MKTSIARRLDRLSVRLNELNQLLSNETVTTDLDNFRKLSREHAEIIPVVDLYHAYQQVEQDLQTAREMASDPEMREFAETEIQAGKEKLAVIETELQKQLLPKDPNDEAQLAD
jgi:peptide chain release factor 1